MDDISDPITRMFCSSFYIKQLFVEFTWSFAAVRSSFELTANPPLFVPVPVLSELK